MTIDIENLRAFVAESNRIEGIHRNPTEAEVAAHDEFLSIDFLAHDDPRAVAAAGIGALQRIVSVLQPDARLRNQVGLNVRVGNHLPPPGGPAILDRLERLFYQLRAHGSGPERAYWVHQEYEFLHPFTDGNGRSGRALWLWMMRSRAPLGFLHHWYYQSLENGR